MEKEAPDLPVGDWAGGKKRKERPADVVAVRVAAFLAEDEVPCRAGVQPLNAGFFALERMRKVEVQTKKVAQTRAKVRGK